MRALVVDFHAGCIAAASTALKRAGWQVDILSLSDHTHLLYDLGLGPDILTGWARTRALRRLGLPPLARRQRPYDVVKSPPTRRRSLVRGAYDVAWVSFPPGFWEAVHHSGLARHTVVNISHRVDQLHTTPEDRLAYFARLEQALEDPTLTFLASNDFDRAYLEHYTGHSAPVLPPWFPYLEEPRRRIGSEPADRPAAIGPAHVRTEVPMLAELAEVMRGVIPPHGPVVSLRETYAKYSFDDLAHHEAFVVLPYSIYSISISELGALGRPLYVPSDKWLIASECLDDVGLAPLYAERAEIEALEQRFPPPGPNAIPLAPAWLDRASWNALPNVTRFDNPEDLVARLTGDADASEDGWLRSEASQEDAHRAWTEMVDLLEDRADAVSASRGQKHRGID